MSLAIEHKGVRTWLDLERPTQPKDIPCHSVECSMGAGMILKVALSHLRPMSEPLTVFPPQKGVKIWSEGGNVVSVDQQISYTAVVLLSAANSKQQAAIIISSMAGLRVKSRDVLPM